MFGGNLVHHLGVLPCRQSFDNTIHIQGRPSHNTEWAEDNLTSNGKQQIVETIILLGKYQHSSSN